MLMVTRIENLPIEIWLLIFSHLEAHDILHAFTNLNDYFHRLLQSDYLLYNIQFKKTNSSDICYGLNAILNRIVSFEWIGKPQYGYLPRFIHKNISDFIRLKSLKIEISPRQIFFICKILPELHSLRNLSIKSENIQSILIETIFILPSVNLCELTSSFEMSNILCNLNGHSNIEILHLMNISIVIQSMTNSFFDHLPNLKKCEICGTTRTLKSLCHWISNEILTFERIPKLKLKCKSNRVTLTFFEQFQLVIPMIKSISLRLYVDIQDEILLENLINNWLIFIEQIKNISIQTSQQIHPEKFSQLLSKTNQWIQTPCPVYKFIAEIDLEA